MTETVEGNGTVANRNSGADMADIPAGADVVDTAVAWNWMTKERVLWVRVKPGAVMGLAEAQEGIDKGREMAGSEPCVMLIDLSGLKSASREARDLYAKSEAHGTSVVGVALVVRTPIARIIGNFFLGFNRPPRPIRMFSDTHEAELWLQGLLAGKNGTV